MFVYVQNVWYCEELSDMPRYSISNLLGFSEQRIDEIEFRMLYFKLENRLKFTLGIMVSKLAKFCSDPILEVGFL